MLNKSLRRFFSYIQTQSVTSDPANLKFNLVKSKTESGQKNNLIVLHGFMGSQSNFRSIVRNQKINSLTNAYLIDQRNHGLSEHKPTMTIPELSQDIKHFIDHHNIEDNIVLMGHSMGGRVVMNMLQNYPELHDRVKGAIVVDILPDNYARKRNPTVQQTFVMVNRLSEIKFANKGVDQVKAEIDEICGAKDVANFVAMQLGEKQDPQFLNNKFYWKSNMPIFANAYMEMIAHETETTEFKGPVKAICGEKSTYINRDQAVESFPRLFPHMNVEEDIIFYKDASHWIHAEKPGQFIDDVSETLKQWL